MFAIVLTIVGVAVTTSYRLGSDCEAQLSHPQELAQLPVCQRRFRQRGQRMGTDSPYAPVARATALNQQAEAKKPPTP